MRARAAGESDRGYGMKFEDYPINIEPVPKDEGGGYMVTFPDLPGCIADGETMEAAIAEARDAFIAWTTAELEDQGRLQSPKTYSGQFVQRIPKTLHQRLAKRAASEGVSLNQWPRYTRAPPSCAIPSSSTATRRSPVTGVSRTPHTRTARCSSRNSSIPDASSLLALLPRPRGRPRDFPLEGAVEAHVVEA